MQTLDAHGGFGPRGRKGIDGHLWLWIKGRPLVRADDDAGERNPVRTSCGSEPAELSKDVGLENE